MDRIYVILCLDHVILLISPHAVLWAEGTGKVNFRTRHERIEGVAAFACHRSRVSEQGNPETFERPSHLSVFKQGVDTQFHTALSVNRKG
jgi:hypothetical protein